MLQQIEEYVTEVDDQTASSDKPEATPRRWRKRVLMFGLPVAMIVLVAAAMLRPTAVQNVTVVQAAAKTITESIASNGTVGSATETYVGAQASGIVEQVLVKEGDHVSPGQQLAVLKRDAARAAVAQAQATLDRTRAEYAETARPALSSEITSASEQVRQAQAQLSQQRAAVTQAEKTLAGNQAQFRLREAELELAEKTLERNKVLVEQGDYSRSQLDSAQEAYKVAQAQESQAQQSVEVAKASLVSAQEGITAAEANVEAKRAQLQTTRIRSTPEQIAVSQLKVREAEESLCVSQQELENAVVVAPFAGIVTKINAQPGQTPGTSGVLSLVSDVTEIQLNVDESNLADLRLGQEAIISSSSFLGDHFKGQVSVISPLVNEDRGTIEVKITPQAPPAWLRPGQTVNVNIITNAAVQRLLVPPTALARSGERTVVFVAQHGRAVEKQVATRSPLADGVPVVTGLEAGDRVIVNAQGIKAGDSVRVE